MLMIFLMSFSLGISSLSAVEPIEDIHGNVVYVYTEEEHRNVIAGFEEVKQWRTMWPQFQFNYSAIADSADIWKNNYSKEAAANFNLKVQRNVMAGISLVTLGTFIVYFLFN